MKIRKGDKVRVMVGKDRGKEGTVERVLGAKIVVAGVNIYKRHQKGRGEGQKGQIIEIIRPLPIANVALICPKCKQVTRVGYRLTEKGKLRICRKCQQEIGS